MLRANRRHSRFNFLVCAILSLSKQEICLVSFPEIARCAFSSLGSSPSKFEGRTAETQNRNAGPKLMRRVLRALPFSQKISSPTSNRKPIGPAKKVIPPPG